MQYLEFYHHCAVSLISSAHDKDFWSKVPLQLAQTEPCVRRALITLGCLNRAETGSLRHARLGLLNPAKQRDMLGHYNKAVKLLVQRISEPSYTPEIGLVCCLLFVCIESLRGNYDTAMSHYKSGLNILKQTRQSSAKGSSCELIEETLTPIYARMLLSAIAFGLPVCSAFIDASVHKYLTTPRPSKSSTLHMIKGQISTLILIVSPRQNCP